MTTLATRVEGGYRLRGQKTWVSNGGIAERPIVFAQTEPARARAGSRRRDRARRRGVVSGSRCASSATGASQRRAVPGRRVRPRREPHRRLGPGLRRPHAQFDRSRVVLASGCVGIARAASEKARSIRASACSSGSLSSSTRWSVVLLLAGRGACRYRRGAAADLAGGRGALRSRREDCRARVDGEVECVRGAHVRRPGERLADARRPQETGASTRWRSGSATPAAQDTRQGSWDIGALSPCRR